MWWKKHTWYDKRKTGGFGLCLQEKYKFWFCTGSQDLYGDECLRKVAVTEGDKVEAQIKFGWEVDAYPVNEVADYVKDVSKGGNFK